MGFPRSGRFRAAALGWALAAASAHAAPAFVPDPASAAGPRLEQATWTDEGPGYALHVTRIDDATRLAYIERFAGVALDPFHARPDVADSYVTFLLELENRGDATLSFNPLQCWLHTNRDEIQLPLGLADLAFSYRVAGLELPAAYERLGPLLLSEARTIEPRRATHGLLVYRTVHPKTRRFSIEVRITLPTGDVARFGAPYRRLRPKEIAAP